mmetsp:Transcript_37616/g.38063  ORF Transcript_37616/g.38063 Transcript_37616/m.38063 type:complete len:133 (-) Transcript_37616:63-461(-)
MVPTNNIVVRFDAGSCLKINKRNAWKCRYCCTPATYICYGGVHFCTKCHHTNSQRVAAAAADSAARRNTPQQQRPRLEAIPCPGDSCHYPKRDGIDRRIIIIDIGCDKSKIVVHGDMMMIRTHTIPNNNYYE